MSNIKELVFHDRPINALWRRVLDNGHDHADRTGKGRRSVFGEQVRFDVSDFSLPLQTTRKIFTRGLIEETLWFIKGSEMASELEEKNINIWKLWTVTDEDIETFVTKLAERQDLQTAMLALHANGDEGQDAKVLVREYYRQLLGGKKGSIGKLYGSMWRNAPQQTDTDMMPFWPDVNPDDIPSDKLSLYTKEYEEMKFFAKGQNIPTFNEYVKQRYYSTVDQLGNLIINLKKRPFSSRHVVVAWVPSHAPFEEVSPQENVLLGKSALTACHTMFQCFVNPPLEEGGKLRLSLMMTIR